MKEIHIFTDGATPNNQNKSGNRHGGVGVFFGTSDSRNISFGMNETEKQKVTNNVCELMACVCAIERIMSTEKVMGKQVVIYTDSMYVVNTIANWASGWEKNGWKKIKLSISIDKKIVGNTLNFYSWYTGNSTCYCDDFKIIMGRNKSRSN